MEDGWQVAANMMEELKMAAVDQHNKLGIGSILLGIEQSKFRLSTGVNFADCDVIGNILLQYHLIIFVLM